MNRKTRLAALLVSAGVVAVAALAVAAPAIGGAAPFDRSTTMAGGPGDGTGPGPGYGMGPGSGYGMGPGPGYGMGGGARMGGGDGTCPRGTATSSGTLTDAQKNTLAAMAEEEKLAGDLYQAFADKYSAVIFDRIAASEDRHLATVRTLLERYSIPDPTAGKAAGEFTNAEVRATYDRLLAQGLTGQSAALSVGQRVEEADIAGLEKALTDLTAPDVRLAYQHLLAASRHHLNAFTR